MMAAAQDWFHARPIYARLKTTLADQCEPMGMELCAMLAPAYVSVMDAKGRQKLGATLEKLCDRSEAKACRVLALGAFPKPSKADRTKLLMRACELDGTECNVAAVCLEKAGTCVGIDPNAALAKRANQRACDDFTSKVKNPDIAAKFPACKKVAAP
jgi:hypothetical protein